MNMLLIAVGKQREPFYRAAAAEYLKRLSRYCRIQEVETADEPEPAGLSPALMKRMVDVEGDRILSVIRPEDTVVALCIDGKQQSSEAFSQFLSEMRLQAGRLVFVIGGSLGLSDRVQSRADHRLSLSDMTFPHQLARVMLLEQIYRGFKIINGERYHK